MIIEFYQKLKIMFGKAISDLMIKPGKSPVFDRPENYGLDYEKCLLHSKRWGRIVLEDAFQAMIDAKII